MIKNNLQVVIMKRYATERNIEKLGRIEANLKITIFDIRKRHKICFLIRKIFRSILPYRIYMYLPKKIDELGDKQKLIWIHPPVISPDINTIILFPPNVDSNVAEELINRLNPKWIHNIMTGIDRLPTMPDSILVTHTRGLHSVRIAEFVMAVVFSFAKNIPEHLNQSRRKIWKSLPSKMVRGAVIGIVGLGSIGTEIAKLAKICGMEVWAINRKAKPANCVDRILSLKDLPRMLEEVDYVVLAVPLTRKTRNLIGKAELSMMKRTACLINICRGAVIDEDSLYNALKKNIIRGACIDVFKDERNLPKNSRFYKLKNLLITSYSTYYSANSNEQVMDLFFNNLERFISGEQLLNIAEKYQLDYNAEA